jgi:GNAT superfamily N-acetyltransferase
VGDANLRPWALADAPALRDAFLTTPDLVTQLGGANLATVAAAEAHIAGPLASDRRHDTAWLHYWLAGSARGRGLATRALAGAAAWAIADGLFRLELGHRVNNVASCAVATRAGFAAEGIERAKLRYGDERFDVETHARLATDPAPAVVPLPGSVGS